MRFTDGGDRVPLGPADLLSLEIVRHTLSLGAGNLLLELPRGAHDVGILVGLFAQVVRMLARHTRDPTQLDFRGPVVVVGMNTQVQDRLRRVELERVDLCAAYGASRVRSDGRILDNHGAIHSLRNVHDERVLYLNTRVGWPSLPAKIRPGAVVVDRTSFSDPRLLERAIGWADAQRAAKVIVVGDVGDQDTRKILGACERGFLRWTWSRQLIDILGQTFAVTDTSSRLSTNRLLLQDYGGVSAAVCETQAVDSLCTDILAALIEAGKLKDKAPRAVVCARRLFSGLVQCVSSLRTYNEWSALDFRTSALLTFRRELESFEIGDATPAWRVFAETRWASLRYDLFELYNLIEEDPPKLFGLAFLLDRVSRDFPSVPIRVRVGSQAAGYALTSDLSDLGVAMDENEGLVTWCPTARRMPWSAKPGIEIYCGALPPWRMAPLWSGESTTRFHLVLPYEARMLRAALQKEMVDQRRTAEVLTDRFKLGALDDVDWAAALDVSYQLQVDKRRRTGSPAAVDFGVDPSLIYADIDEHEPGYHGASSPSAGRLVTAIPVLLEPGTETWWVREGAYVDVLRGTAHEHIDSRELRVGERIVVPKGEGREALFERIVSAAHSKSDVRAYEVFFERWRAACQKVYERCDRNWKAVEKRMQEEGSTVTWQSFRLWARGHIIAPSDENDIARIGRVAGDELIEKQYRRIGSMAKQLRLLHRRLGKHLSLAISEAAEGGGVHLDAVGDLLDDTVDVAEILDEFDIRTIGSIGEAKEVPSSMLGQITAGSSA